MLQVRQRTAAVIAKLWHFHLPNKSVHFGDIDVVELLDSLLDLKLVCLQRDDEDQGVEFFNLLHGTLCCQRVLDGAELVQPKETTTTLISLCF